MEQGNKTSWINTRIFRNNDELATKSKSAPDLPYREVKGIGMEQGPGVGRAKGEPVICLCKKSPDIRMRIADALWFSCRS